MDDVCGNAIGKTGNLPNFDSVLESVLALLNALCTREMAVMLCLMFGSEKTLTKNQRL
nr:hypothetical protein XNA1_530024 [Xenorhabdus nematophila str. Anatoliense]